MYPHPTFSSNSALLHCLPDHVVVLLFVLFGFFFFWGGGTQDFVEYITNDIFILHLETQTSAVVPHSVVAVCEPPAGQPPWPSAQPPSWQCPPVERV